ncbi:hypothetical protein ACLOJK_035672 [Asimina triloba]
MKGEDKASPALRRVTYGRGVEEGDKWRRRGRQRSERRGGRLTTEALRKAMNKEGGVDGEGGEEDRTNDAGEGRI